jgi:haloalkane dehalogenase
LGPEAYEFLKAFRDPVMGRNLIVDDNACIEKGLPDGIVRKLSPNEMAEYRRPFLVPKDREPIYRFLDVCV